MLFYIFKDCSFIDCDCAIESAKPCVCLLYRCEVRDCKTLLRAPFPSLVIRTNSRAVHAIAKTLQRLIRYRLTWWQKRKPKGTVAWPP